MRARKGRFTLGLMLVRELPPKPGDYRFYKPELGNCALALQLSSAETETFLPLFAIMNYRLLVVIIARFWWNNAIRVGETICANWNVVSCSWLWRCQFCKLVRHIFGFDGLSRVCLLILKTVDRGWFQWAKDLNFLNCLLFNLIFNDFNKVDLKNFYNFQNSLIH